MTPKNLSAYQRLMQSIASRLPKKSQEIFLHPAGPTTIFFWAPTFKWGLVFAGIGDLKRPSNQISLYQTFSLMLTGLIWSRYSLVIVPKNYYLFSANVFVSLTNAYNFIRGNIYHYNSKSAVETGKGQTKK